MKFSTVPKRNSLGKMRNWKKKKDQKERKPIKSKKVSSCEKGGEDLRLKTMMMVMIHVCMSTNLYTKF